MRDISFRVLVPAYTGNGDPTAGLREAAVVRLLPGVCLLPPVLLVRVRALPRGPAQRLGPASPPTPWGRRLQYVARCRLELVANLERMGLIWLVLLIVLEGASGT